jgi:large subunit ribosomal protein L33
MAKSDKRVKITLECTECKERNYITMKSKINDRERLEMKKFCAKDRRHTLHKATCVGQRAVAQLVEHRSPKPTVGGSSPSCPAKNVQISSTHNTYEI